MKITIEQSTLLGYQENTVTIFKGIPYAEAPVGELRWRPPQPALPWEGVRETTKFGPVAHQKATEINDFMNTLMAGVGHGFFRRNMIKAAMRLIGGEKESEDCLYLNIRTPEPDKHAKLPVMVWIHGGDHQDGSGSEPFYDSNTLPELGAVVVTFNYRLGLLGYFCHPDLALESEHKVSGNYGTLDQIAALKWVQKNIDAFGGDPDNVTIFGESAGGESVAHMMTSPFATGLFHGAILQSPANSGQMVKMRTPSLQHRSAEDIGSDFASQLVGEGEQLKKLRALSADELMKAARAANKELGLFFPVIDGHVLPLSPFEAFRRGSQAKVPMIVGSNSDEGSVIFPMMKTPLIAHRFSEISNEGIQQLIQDEFKDDADTLIAMYPGVTKGEQTALASLLGDSMFGANAFYYALQHATHGAKSFLYHFEQTSPLPGQTAGAFHGADLPYVFGSESSLLPMDDSGRDLSKLMSRYWANFAATSNPGGPDQMKWQAFDPDQPRWMRFGPASGMDEISRLPNYILLNKYLTRNLEAVHLEALEGSNTSA